MKISLTREMPVAYNCAHQAIKATLIALTHDAHTEHVSLSASVGAGAQEAMRVGVPIALVTNAQHARWNEDFSLSVRALSHAAAFPTFAGTITVRAFAHSRSRITLAGIYQVPFGVLGATLNAIALSRIARASLERFLDQIVQAAMCRITTAAAVAYGQSRRGVG